MSLRPASTRGPSGVGGMLVIATLGLAVLVFGGIVTNSRAAESKRHAIETAKMALLRHEQLKPLDDQVRRAAEQVRARPAVPGGGPGVLVEPSEIPALRETLGRVATDVGLSVQALTHTVDSSDPEDYRVRFDFRLRGDYLRMRELFDALHGLGFRLQVDGFSIRGGVGSQELQVLFQVGMQ